MVLHLLDDAHYVSDSLLQRQQSEEVVGVPAWAGQGVDDIVDDTGRAVVRSDVEQITDQRAGLERCQVRRQLRQPPEFARVLASLVVEGGVDLLATTLGTRQQVVHIRNLPL